MKEKIVVLSGAGMSAESGISTFRDANGLWEQYDIMEVASIDAWRRNPELVLRFYNQRRRQLFDVEPNEGHKALVALESRYDVRIITQNIDDLHERAGSTQIIHLHGEMRKVRSTQHPHLIYNWLEDLAIGDKCEKGAQLRPHIVWFGEAVPLFEEAAEEIETANHVIIIGTSMQVYPAAGLVSFAPSNAPVYYIDPKPHINYELMERGTLQLVKEPATTGVRKIVDELMK